MPKDFVGKEDMINFEESHADLSSEIMNITVNENVVVPFDVNDHIYNMT